MALFKSTYFAQIVNTLAGTVFFYNRYGSIVGRNYVVPTDPNTPAQQTIRARFSAGMAAWQGLTAAQRQAWDSYAADTPWKSALGDNVHLPGMNMYLSVQLAALQIDNTIPIATFSSPPCIPGLFPPCDVDITPCTSGIMNAGFKITVTNSTHVNSLSLGVHLSTAQNTSVNFWKGPYDQRAYFVVANVLVGFPKVQDVIGLVQGSRYFFKYRVLDNVSKNHVSSPWYDHYDVGFCTS